MRPVHRDDDPFQGQIGDYKNAKPALIQRISAGRSSNKAHLGSYCSYCERNLPTSIAVEHIEPKKGQYGQPHLINEWTNFLLSCTNCNSTKKDKQVIFSELFFPDRDNTFYAFQYLPDGTVTPNPQLTPAQQKIAQDTLELVGLQKPTPNDIPDDIALDRLGQRMQAWGQAKLSKQRYLTATDKALFVEITVDQMISTGFFSVWMTVFEDVPDMKIAFIRAISGTEESGCFDMTTGDTLSPHPNTDNLVQGRKI